MPSRRTRPWIWAAAAGAGALAVGATSLLVYEEASVGRCVAITSAGTEGITSNQARHVATIAGLSVQRELPTQAATIAVATAIQESKISNLDYGDRDSLGLFQQRPSAGWGTEEELQDPVYATNAFYDALAELEGWESDSVTVAAQRVQLSAYPDAYADHEDEARVLALAATGDEPGTVGCRIGDAGNASAPESVASALQEELGVATQIGSRLGQPTLTVQTESERTAGAVGAWAVLSAAEYGIAQVSSAGRSWNRGEGREARTWQEDEDAPTPATEVVITLRN